MLCRFLLTFHFSSLCNVVISFLQLMLYLQKGKKHDCNNNKKKLYFKSSVHVVSEVLARTEEQGLSEPKICFWKDIGEEDSKNSGKRDRSGSLKRNTGVNSEVMTYYVLLTAINLFLMLSMFLLQIRYVLPQFVCLLCLTTCGYRQQVGDLWCSHLKSFITLMFHTELSQVIKGN